MAQVSGHSELMTSVRFSPDGKYILSVGGDGCIMKWSLDDYIINSMQERMLEIEMNKKHDKQLSPSRTRDKHEASAVPVHFLPPPPIPEEEEFTPPSPPHTERTEEDDLMAVGSVPIGTSADSSPQIASDVLAVNKSKFSSENWLEDMVRTNDSDRTYIQRIM